MMLIATLTAFIVANGGRSAWFIGVLVLNVYLRLRNRLISVAPQASVSAAMTKRPGRLFIDYLRNQRGTTGRSDCPEHGDSYSSAPSSIGPVIARCVSGS